MISYYKLIGMNRDGIARARDLELEILSSRSGVLFAHGSF